MSLKALRYYEAEIRYSTAAVIGLILGGVVSHFTTANFYMVIYTFELLALALAINYFEVEDISRKENLGLAAIPFIFSPLVGFLVAGVCWHLAEEKEAVTP